MSETTPYRVQVTAVAEYVADQSRPQDEHFVFAYHITVLNTGEVRAQLLARHWVITDGNGKMQEVHGQGVVGEQPVLGPGDSFDYTSFCDLDSPVGTMHGSYRMVRAGGETFEAHIAPFTLAVPNALN